ncbi:MAG: alpha/beta hydrolase [Candidatus Hydrogenedentes bacterium]|nr:alpha/beta hydrolase [Candidatus Hydrogenedentota bacterium]
MMESYISPRVLWAALLGLLLLVASGCPAENMRVTKDIPYADSGNADPNLVSLDVYAPESGADCPVVIYVHGGGRRRGDKSNVNAKPGRFTAEGYVFVSLNYRLSPDVVHPVHVQDVANAIAWVHENIASHGGDAGKLFLLGHSAGAYLVALVGVDERYLQNAGKDLNILTGVVPLDTAAYDIPLRLWLSGSGMQDLIANAFGTDPEVHADASPVTHVAPEKDIPDFLLVYVASREIARIEAEGFEERLNEANVPVEVYPAEGKNHMTLNRELGLPDDPPTDKVLEFFNALLAN